MAIDFYRGFTSGGFRTGLTTTYGVIGGVNPFSYPASAGLMREAVVRRMYRYNFPGLYKEERAARATMQCPAQAAITEDSTVTLSDPVVGPQAYEFDKNASGLIAGDILVDIGAAVTPADVAAAFAAAINGSAQLITAYPGADGRLHLIGKSDIPGVFPHSGATGGAAGNQPITPSIPGEWPGIPAGLAGGKQSLNGVEYIPICQSGPIRLLAMSEFTKQAI